jgi:hypothetical protein
MDSDDGRPESNNGTITFHDDKKAWFVQVIERGLEAVLNEPWIDILEALFLCVLLIVALIAYSCQPEFRHTGPLAILWKTTTATNSTMQA